MHPLQRIAILIVSLAISSPSIAGMEKESYSSRPGVFFAWLSPDDGYVLARFDSHTDLRNLAKHCNAEREVFSLQNGTRYKCKLEVFKLPSGEEYWESAGASVLGPSPKSDTRQFGVFSTKPPRTPSWGMRAATQTDLAGLDALLSSADPKLGVEKRQLNRTKASVRGRPGSSYLTIIVPGKIVEDREAFYAAQRHHVFTKRNGAYAYLGEVPGKPIYLVDIDGDDLPGLVVSEGCDGWCISLWSLKDGLQQVGTFGGH